MKKRRPRTTIIVLLVCILFLVFSYIFSGGEKITLTDQVRASLPGKFAHLSNGVTHFEYSENQNTPVVVLVHGFSVPYYIWDPTFSALSDNGFSVLRYDLYGRGYSDRPEIEYDLDLYVNQLSELLEHLDIGRPVHLVGLSQGGPVAAAFANQYPHQARSLTLIDPLITRVTTKTIFPINVPFVGEYFARVVLIPHILPASQVDDFHHPENYPDWEDKYRDQLQYTGFTQAILSSLRNLPAFNSLTEYEQVLVNQIPFQVIWGQEDQTIAYSDIELLLDTVPAAELHIIQNAGHLPHYEQPDVVNPFLIEFLVKTGF